MTRSSAALAVRRGYNLHVRGLLDDAEAEYRRALALDEGCFDAWYALGCAAFARGSETEAVRCFRRALVLRPKHARTEFNCAWALFGTGNIDAAIDGFRTVAMDSPELRREALGRIARYVPGSPLADNAAVLAARRAWAETEAIAQGATIRRRRARRSGDRLRIGYISAFFGQPNWLKPVWGVINNHDRRRFEIHLYSDGEAPTDDSGYRSDLRDHIHEARDRSNRELATSMVRDGIDVLIDLNGYSFQERLGLFMRKPAPVILGWFNMYATTGIDAFDYIVGDDAVMPGEEEERFYSEHVLRVPGSYLAFSVLYPVPDVAPPPCITTGQITFGSFASPYKLIDPVIEAWAAILRGAPRARLLLKNRALSDASNRAALRERFQRREIACDRVTLEGPAEHQEFLAAYARVDIALDTFPYNGGTTTSEALWQGVPVLSFHGDRWASRTSGSLLRAAGLADWCMRDLASYIERGISLARTKTTPSELKAQRSSMRRRLRNASVCDSARLCRALEDFYRLALNEGGAL